MANPTAAREILFSLELIGKLVLETQRFWASALSITVPQWGIVTAIFELDRGAGVKVGEVARRLRVDASFVTSQTKMLEKAGLVARRQSGEDSRVILMSLTTQTLSQLEKLAPRQRKLSEFLFNEIEAFEVRTLREALKSLEKRLLKAELVLSLDE